MSLPSIEEFSAALRSFGWTDYTVFVIMLVVCMVIGLYFSVENSKKVKDGNCSEALDYLVGGRKLTLLPVSLSLVASVLSGIGVLGTSTEIYVYGSQYVLTMLALVLVGLSLHFCVLPVLHRLEFISLYEYLDRRFNRWLRLFGSVMYLLSMFIKIPIIVYVPAIAFNQVTGIDITVTTPIVCLVCIFYTCLGGLKAVIWTDVIQSVVMLGSLIIVAIRATYVVGGVGVVVERNLNSTRIEAPIFDFDPTIRSTVWSVVVGGWFYHLSLSGIDQSLMQRYLSLPTLRKARQAVWLFVLGFCLIVGFSMFNGFLLYAIYHDCDPLSTGLVKRKDQLIPLLVMDIMGRYPWICGFFVTGVFSASLSTVSTALNSMSAVVLEDFFKLIYGNRLSEKSIGYILRITVIAIGLTTMGLVFVVEKLGPVLELTISLAGVTNGPLAGVFVIGLGMPWIGSKPTMIGAVSGVIVSSWVIFKAQIDTLSKVLTYETKSFSTENCPYTFNTVRVEQVVESEKAFYHVSYLYYCFVGGVVTIVVANVWCLIFGKQDSSRVDLELLMPPVRRLYGGSKSIPMKTLKSANIEQTYVPDKLPAGY